MKKRVVKVIASNPSGEDNWKQDDIIDYIGMEFEVVSWWKSKDSPLAKGQIQVVLKGDKDPNPKNQLSILNESEYVFV